MGKVPNWECLFGHREKGLFLSVYVDDIRTAGKLGVLGEPTSFVDHVYLGCTERECKPNENIIEEN